MTKRRRDIENDKESKRKKKRVEETETVPKGLGKFGEREREEEGRRQREKDGKKTEEREIDRQTETEN